MSAAATNAANADYTELAKSYQKDFNAVTGEFAKTLVGLAPYLATTSAVLLDNACGPGAVTEAVLKATGPTPPKIHAVDSAQGMVDIVKSRWENVIAEVMDGQNLTFEEGKFTHVLSTFGVFLFTDSQKGLEESVRVLKEGGWFGNTSWNHLAWEKPAEVAFKRLKPDSEGVKWPMPPRWRTEEDVRGRFEEAGLKQIQVRLETNYAIAESCTQIVGMMGPFLKQLIPSVGKLPAEEYDLYCKYLAEEMDKDVVHKDGHVEAKLVAVIAHGTK